MNRTGRPQPPSTVAEAAEAYTALGWRIVPVIPNTKRPALTDWTTRNVTDPDGVTQWFRPDTRFGVGIVTGNGLTVIDVDGPAGTTSLHHLETRHGQLPETVTVTTPGGGLHLYFKTPANHDAATNRSTLGAGIDIRGAGGFVVAPPTIHPNGRPYQYFNGLDPWTIEPAELDPTWLNLTARPQPVPPPAPDTVTDSPHGPQTSPADETLTQAVETVYGPFSRTLEHDGWAHIATDPNGDTYWCRPGKNPRDGHSAILKADQVLVVFSTNAPPELLTVERSKPGGHWTHNLFQYVTATRHQGDPSATARHVRTVTGTLTDHRQTVAETLTPPTTDTDDSDGPKTEADPPPPPGLTIHRATDRRHILDKPVTWLINGVLTTDTACILGGPKKTLKSTLLLHQAVAIAAGIPLLDTFHTPTPRNVLILAGEGGEHLTLTRLERIAAAYQLDQIPNGIYYTIDPLHMTQKGIVDTINTHADRLDIGLIIVDPFYRYRGPGARSGDVFEMGQILADFTGPLQTPDRAVVIAHHYAATRHTTGHDLDSLSMAGAAEFADTWQLLGHRKPPDPSNGRYALDVTLGSRRWGADRWFIDYHDSTFDIDTNGWITPPTWTVTRPGHDHDDNDGAPGRRQTVTPAQALTRAGRRWRDPYGKEQWVIRARDTVDPDTEKPPSRVDVRDQFDLWVDLGWYDQHDTGNRAPTYTFRVEGPKTGGHTQ